MYQITATYDQHSATFVGKPTMAEACNEIAYLWDYYKPLYDNTKVFMMHHCDDCSRGKVKKCKAPRRHSNGYHGERCYVTCKTCKGNYETPVEA